MYFQSLRNSSLSGISLTRAINQAFNEMYLLYISTVYRGEIKKGSDPFFSF